MHEWENSIQQKKINNELYWNGRKCNLRIAEPVMENCFKESNEDYHA